jgi:3-dehydroquinate dehydratase / shikimate dehydrogenase
MICAVVRAETHERALADLAEARRQGADLAELRLDYLREPIDLPRLLDARPLPVLATLRPAWEGGHFSGTEEERTAILERACVVGADYVDVEFRRFRRFALGKTKLVLSYHDFETTPDDLEATAAAMGATHPFLVKIACQARGTSDLIRLVRLQKSLPGAAIIAMGDYGEPLRVLYARYGGRLTYAALRSGGESAPGQLTVEELTRLFQVKSMDASTAVYGVIGNPVGHSKSPALFNDVFKSLGMNARYARIKVDDPTLAKELVKVLELRGLSVTIPHKQAALKAADEADEISSGSGAANTLTAKDGRLLASNTDIPAAMEAIKDAAVKKWSHGIYGMRALVLGAGGVARAIAWGLKREAARVTIANRTFERAKAMAEELGVDCVRWHEMAAARAQIVVNGTSVGMTPDVEASPVDAAFFGKDMVAMDTVYTPRQTRFLRDAQARGADVIEGVEMFVRQANLQFKTWTGRPIPTEIYKEWKAKL